MPFLLYRKDWGVYVGSALGLSFWSKLDAVGQPGAPVFETEEDVKNAAIEMTLPNLDLYQALPVVPDMGATPDKWTHASMANCVAAGAEPWEC